MLNAKLDPTWKYSDYILSDEGNPVGIQVKFKGKGKGREMVESDATEYSLIRSVSLGAFINDAVNSALQIIEGEVRNYYVLDNYLPEEKKEINEMLEGFISDLKIPELFKIFVSGLTFKIPTDIKKKYEFKNDLKIPYQERTKEYKKYQDFLNKLINLNYIKS